MRITFETRTIEDDFGETGPVGRGYSGDGSGKEPASLIHPS
jgi:hypothetical protein